MKNFFLEIAMFVNSFLTLLFLNLATKNEIHIFEESGIENGIAVLFVPIFICFVGVILIIIDTIITVLAIIYIKNETIKFSTFNKNKKLDVLQLVIFFIALLCIINFIRVHNWFGVILSVFAMSHIYIYIVLIKNIYQFRKKRILEKDQ